MKQMDAFKHPFNVDMLITVFASIKQYMHEQIRLSFYCMHSVA